jgi:predicted nucleic acid-binding protein
VRAVLDTNTVISGFLWDGAASGLLTAARDQRIALHQRGPAHLLDLKHYQRIEIVNSSEALRILADPPQSV